MNYPDWLQLMIPDLLAMDMPMRWEFAREVGKGKKDQFCAAHFGVGTAKYYSRCITRPSNGIIHRTSSFFWQGRIVKSTV